MEQLEEDTDDIALQKARRTMGSMSAMSGAHGMVYMEYQYGFLFTHNDFQFLSNYIGPQVHCICDIFFKSFKLPMALISCLYLQLQSLISMQLLRKVRNLKYGVATSRLDNSYKYIFFETI